MIEMIKTVIYPLIGNLFAGQLNTNVTTQTGSGQDLSGEMKTYYSDHLIDMAEPELIYDQFADKYPIPQGRGKSIEFRKWSQLPKNMTKLTEGVTPDGQTMDMSVIPATVDQYGAYVTVSDVLTLTAIDPIMVQATEMIGSQAGRSLNTVTREVVMGGSNVIYAANNGTRAGSRTAITNAHKLTLDDVRAAVLQLKRYNAPRIDGSYVAIIHPDVAADIMGSEGWIDVVKYQASDRIFEGEIGKIAGVRFIENTEAKIWKGAGASSANVYGTIFLGKGAYATTEVSGGGLRHIVKQLGSAGTADPLDQRATVGWKATKVTKRLIEEYMVRVESGATAGATAIEN